MKKFMVYLCTGMMLALVAACGGNGDGSQTGGVEDSEIQSSTGSNSEESTDNDMDSDGNLSGSNDYAEGWSEEMNELKSAVVDVLGENYWPDMAVLPDMLEMSFGITSDMYEDYMAEMPMISNNVDSLVIIKAKEDMADAVWEALNKYREDKVNDTMQYPMNVGKIQASRVERIGNYVIFVQLGADVMDAMESGDEAVIAQCSGVNEQVIEIITGKLRQ